MASPCDIGITLLEKQSCGIQQDGFGLEIQGHKHTSPNPGFCTVYLDNGTTYRIRIYNTNNFSAMVKLSLDGVNIGTFYLQPLSKYDIERPVDRPLAFVFGYPSLAPSDPQDTTPPKGDVHNPKLSKQSIAETDVMVKLQSTIVATFQPEAGAKTFQADIHFPHLQSSHRVELRADMTLPDVRQLFAETAGTWVLDPKSVLLTWCTAEYDSPVQDVIHTSGEHATLKPDNRKCLPPLLKMSVLLVETLYISIHHTSTQLCLSLDSCPTLSHLLEHVHLSMGPSQGPLYLCSEAGRYLGSTEWLQGSSFVAGLFTRHELSEMPALTSLSVVVHNTRPPHVFHIVCRQADDTKVFLEVDKHSHILQCRHQLQWLGGPAMDQSMWMYGGELLDSSQTVEECGLGHKSCVDVIRRKSKTLSSLEMKDPIAVEGLCNINTLELMKKVDDKVKEKAKRRKCEKHKKHRLRRGERFNTILRGHVNQQFIEVNAIEVDDRFNTNLSITVLPKELQTADFRPTEPPDDVAITSKSVCTLL